MKAYLALTLSIALEVLATANVQLSAQFTRLGPTLTMAGGYLLALYFMSLALASLPARWSMPPGAGWGFWPSPLSGAWPLARS